jgi:hypothetical protein
MTATIRPPRSLIVTTMPLVMIVAGCSNPWAQHYRASGEPRDVTGMESSTAVTLIEKPADTITMTDPPAGLIELGSSRFELDARAGAAGLTSLAEQVGAAEVWWAIDVLDSTVSTSTVRIPSYDRSRTTGSVTNPDGSRRSVDLTTSATRWEDVPVTTTTTRYWHVARLFGAAHQ